jgi:hypothetical protein
MTQKDAEQIATKYVEKQSSKYDRDERGVKIQTYRRFKDGIDYTPVEPDEMRAIIGLATNHLKRGGRPPVFSGLEELQGAIQAYWDYISTQNDQGIKLIPDVEGLCCYIGISRETLNKWENANYQGFGDTIKASKNAIAACKKQLALHGKIPPIVFATDFNNNHGYVQKQSLEVTANNPMGAEQNQKALEDTITASIVLEE